jgi:hypothetical protein
MNPAVAEWVSKAEGDFLTAGRELRVRKVPNYDVVCFHAQHSERFLTGQAYLETPYTALDTPIFIHQGGVMDRPAHPHQTGAGGGEGGEQVREVVGRADRAWPVWHAV